MRRAAVILEAELRRRRISFRVLPDGAYEIDGGGRMVLDLVNVSRDLDGDGDPGRVVRFLESALGVFAPLPPWSEARGRVFWCPERADADFGDSWRASVTARLSRVLVFADLEAGRIRWLTPRSLEAWGVSTRQAEAAAEENLDGLLRVGLTVERGDGRALGMVSAEPCLKASVVFAPGLEKLVAEELGWPVLAVIPCRDFLYLFGEGDDVIDVLGPIVHEEFRGSAYPLTTEVLRISTSGIQAIAHFPE